MEAIKAKNCVCADKGDYVIIDPSKKDKQQACQEAIEKLTASLLFPKPNEPIDSRLFSHQGIDVVTFEEPPSPWANLSKYVWTTISNIFLSQNQP